MFGPELPSAVNPERRQTLIPQGTIFVAGRSVFVSRKIHWSIP